MLHVEVSIKAARPHDVIHALVALKKRMLADVSCPVEGGRVLSGRYESRDRGVTVCRVASHGDGNGPYPADGEEG